MPTWIIEGEPSKDTNPINPWNVCILENDLDGPVIARVRGRTQTECALRAKWICENFPQNPFLIKR